jgi:homoserine O-acetyltransferase
VAIPFEDEDSVGLVEPRIEHFAEPFPLACGEVLPAFDLIVETYGTLNSNRSNAVLVCHALSGNHHAAGKHSPEDAKPGWWDTLIGPGKPVDTNRFFVVSLNNLGGCDGSTGPNTINPATGEAWGPDFPDVTVKDWVNSQLALADRLEIDRWAVVIGGSLGGMQALYWAVHHPDRVANCAVLAAAPRLTAQNIAFNEIARHAITSDPDWLEGHYSKQQTVPARGLALARMVGHLTYMSAEGMTDKFGRERRATEQNGEPEIFEVESYLRYQGAQFSTRFDANTYLLMTRALDYFDIADYTDGDLSTALSPISARLLVVSFSSDWRFSPARSREMVDALITTNKDVSYAEIETDGGHDAFLLNDPDYCHLMRAWLEQVTL